ncbi:class I SAM-dependent methyltransferase [Nocardioides pocheonensis]|uniref:Methyltransferase domain-containing protein n=1 Tax=Nocardioides pocheonensis TaxID=661485 RepID=A0A3N0GZY7_9ACTN|nr:methyltransferase [Nocardioides pocheonensis]RNM17720.1 methyltransferase domain-containing protein [Nocardioides pocheonensis]
MTEIPRTRWETSENSGFAAHFSELIATGGDIEGEARLADALLPRGATVLDAGAGFGRVGAALQARGHHVVAAEKDPDLVAMAAEHYPDLPMVRTDILALTPDLLAEAGHPTTYDLVVLVGNVIVLLAPDTEQRALRTLAALLAEGGRILVGFHMKEAPTSSARAYPFEQFVADVEAVGLKVQHRFGSYELAPANDDYCVAVLSLV